MSESDRKDSYLGPVQNSALAGAVFQPRSDLSYRTFENVHLNDISIQQSLLTGALVRNSSFRAVDFSRSDLDGARFEHCTFTDCDLTNVEIRSAVLTRCTFDNCPFDSSYVIDTLFAETRVTGCRFVGAVITESTFDRCDLERTDIARTSTTHNRFKDTRFANMTLGDCTFLYTIATGCTFADSRMNAESVGMTYGLTRADVASLGMMFLGKEEQRPPGYEIIPALVESYKQRRWFIGVCVLNINFGLTSVTAAIGTYLSELRRQAGEGHLGKRDELVFFAAVLRQLAEESRLPLMSCTDAVETVAFLADLRNSAADGGSSGLDLLRTQLAVLLDRLLAPFNHDEPLAVPGASDQSVVATLYFDTEPNIDLPALFNEVASASGLPIVQPTTIVETRRGSFVSVMTTSVGTVYAFRTFLYIVNGCIVELTKMRARVNVLLQPTLPPAYRKDALAPPRRVSERALDSVRSIKAMATTFRGLADPNLNGIAPPNLREISMALSEQESD